MSERKAVLAPLAYLLAPLALVACGSGGSWPDARVLMIGNSHTYYNDMPETIEALAEALYDLDVEIETEVPAGYELREHVDRRKTRLAILRGVWDFVVLQESGRLAAIPPSDAEDDIYPHAITLAERVREQAPDALLLFFMTAGYRNGATHRPEPELQTYEAHQARIEEHYRRMVSDTEAELAPAGLVWQELFEADETLVLHDDDDEHENELGSFVSALVILRTMLGAPDPDATLPRPFRSAPYPDLLDQVNAIDVEALAEPPAAP